MFELARANASLMALGIDLRHDSYSRGLQAPGQSAEDLLIVFVAPPWGNALSERSGLDLRCTQPPVAEVIVAGRPSSSSPLCSAWTCLSIALAASSAPFVRDG